MLRGALAVASRLRGRAPFLGTASDPGPGERGRGYLASLRGRREAGVGAVVAAQRHHARQDLVVQLEREDGHQHDDDGDGGLAPHRTGPPQQAPSAAAAAASTRPKETRTRRRVTAPERHSIKMADAAGRC